LTPASLATTIRHPGPTIEVRWTTARRKRRRLGRSPVEVTTLGLGTAALGGMYASVADDRGDRRPYARRSPRA
jgi:hypothetical protein